MNRQETSASNEYDTLADYKEFKRILASLLKDHKGKYVVIHDRKPVQFFGNLHDAVAFGVATYAPRHFIAQEVKQEEPAVLYSLLV